MQTFVSLIVYIAIFLGVILLVDAAIGIIQSLRGYDEDAVGRRLSNARGMSVIEGAATILPSAESNAWYRYLPLNDTLEEMLAQSGSKDTLAFLWIKIAALMLFLFILLAYLLPPSFLLLSLVLAIGGAVGVAMLSLRRSISKRISKFTEQLPDAIDLMVRSLQVGHPVVGAMGVIAREMPEPIGPEFKIACDQITYGNEVPAAFLQMSERMPVMELRYLTVVIQVQSESGGNLVESLSKLSAVMRDRFRMFRKVKALTVEGRVSAYILSLFPIFIGIALWLVKPDYFDQAMQYSGINLIIFILAVLLVINLFAMRTITNIKV